MLILLLTAVVIPTDEFEVLSQYPELCSVLALLILPLVEFQTTFNEYRASLLEILIDYLCPITKHLDIDKTHLLPLRTILLFEGSVNSQSEFDNRRLALKI